ncbi:uncharacterized protein COLE_02902 [Cutaneotrichosporon oleaginosum]|nr:hypothetical protein COLE_02902 [Cutaneotrichosporon oleaginosum]
METEQYQSLEEVLDDLVVRFIDSLPEEEKTPDRLIWQAEEAHWFYEDWVQPQNPSLPMLNQRNLTQLLLEHTGQYPGLDFDEQWQKFLAYKKVVPCCGGILLNTTGDKVLMVRGWKNGSSWVFPRGKINSNETPEACAIREVYEETGYDMKPLFNPNEFIRTTMNRRQEVTMYLVFGVDENTVFKTKTMKEIGKIEWVPVVELPLWSNAKGTPKPAAGGKARKFFSVGPFVNGIKKFLKKNGVNLEQLRQNQSGRGKGRGRGGQQQGGRQLQPFAFDAGAGRAGRELQPFLFGDEPKPVPTGTPLTEMDLLFSKFVGTKEDIKPVAGTQSSFSAAHVHARASDDQNDDETLARLLGNLGPVSDAPPAPTHHSRVHAAHPAPTPPLDQKQAKFLQILQARPSHAAAPNHQPAPRHSEHQNNLLAAISSPTKAAPAPVYAPVSTHVQQAPLLSEDEERAQRQRALLDSLLEFPASPSTAPAHSRGPSVGPSPMPNTYSSQGPSPIPPNWSSYPSTQPSPYPSSQAPPAAQPPQPPPIPQHTRPQQYDYAQQQQQLPQAPSQPTHNEHQRNLLGALYGKAAQAPLADGNVATYGQPTNPHSASSYSQPSAAGQPAAPAHHNQQDQVSIHGYAHPVQPPHPNYGQPGQQPGPPHAGGYNQHGQVAQPIQQYQIGKQPSAAYVQAGQPPAPANFAQQGQHSIVYNHANQPNNAANYIPAQHVQPPTYYGHQRQLSGGLPGQPGQGRPIGAVGLPGQPGQPAPGWNMQQQFQFQNQNQGLPGQPGAPPQMGQQYQHQPPQPAPGYAQQYPLPQHAQVTQLVQPNPQLQQPQNNQPPARAAQTSPAMHQPVARPPVSGSLLGLAAGR